MEITRLFEIIQKQLEKKPKSDAFVTKVKGTWVKTPTQSIINQADKMSRGLLKLGIKPNDRIAIITNNSRTEWHIMDYAIQQVGGISVPIYPTISVEDNAYIFQDAEVKFCFVSDEVLYKKVNEIKKLYNGLVSCFTFDEVEGAPNWYEIMEMGEDDATQHEVESVKEMIKPTDLVTLIYTSGTTGKPKGVMLTHENILQNVLYSNPRVPKADVDDVKALSFLPICHIFERMITYLYQYNGFSIYFAESIDTIGDNVKEIKPQFMSVVPRLIEKVYAKIYHKGTVEGGKLKAKIFLWALSLVENYQPYQGKSFMLKLADKIVFKKWREGLGGNMVCLISGSAALSSRLNSIFWGAGIPILEGYGLTETSPVISVNTFGKGNVGVGTVGKPLDNLKVRLAEDGEILVKGPSVTQGYLNNVEATKESFTEDGFFKTGDIGEFQNGLLKITDRKKEMFKTSGGKYVAPQMIENQLKQSKFIEQVMVVGDGEKMPCALVQPDFQFIKDWANYKQIHLEDDSITGIANNPMIKERIEKEIQKLNETLGKWEQVKRIELTPEIWSIEAGLLTPTLKLKRKIIKEHFIDLYKKLYA